MCAKQLQQGLIVCWVLGIAFCAASTVAASGPQSKHEKSIKSKTAPPSRWDWRNQYLAISPYGKWLAACLWGSASCRKPQWAWGVAWLLNLSSGQARPTRVSPLRREVLTLDSVMNPFIYMIARRYSSGVPLADRYEDHKGYVRMILNSPIGSVEREVEQYFGKLSGAPQAQMTPTSHLTWPLRKLDQCD